MFNLVQFIENQVSSREIDQKKEKSATDQAAIAGNISYSAPSQSISSQESALGEKPRELSLTDIPAEQKSIGNSSQTKDLAPSVPVSGKSAVRDLNHNPSVGANQRAPRPETPQQFTRIPRPFSKIAYKRNTGLEDSNGFPYTNTDDVILLSKLGYTIDEDSYLFLPRGEEREALYTYIEKNAGVPKDVSRCIDEGTAFSSEYLKDMDYEIPKGYEIKGDLCCPVEKTAFELNESHEKTASNLTAVVIKGNPKYLNNTHADKFYDDVAGHLKNHGYNVSFDAGNAHTIPKPADLWVGHSRGAGRLKYAPSNTKTIALGDAGGINHNKDKSLSKDGPAPNKWHFTLSNSMKREIDQIIGKEKTASDIYNNIVIENPKGSKKEFGKNYPIPVMTYPVDYGYLPGYTAQDDADLDFFKGTAQKDGLHGSFDVWRPDVKGELETKFYTGATEPERDQILKAFQKVIRGTPKSYISNDLMEAIKHFAVNKDVEKTASTLVVSGIHGDEPAGDVAAKKLEEHVDVVSEINPSNKRRFRGKDINRHFDKPSEGNKQKRLLDIIKEKKPSRVISLHEDNEVDKPYAYSSESLKEETKRALKDKDTAASAHGDKTEDGVISEGKNPPDGSLEKALDNRGIDRVTVETPSKSQGIAQRVKTQLDVVKELLGKKAALGDTNPSMSLNTESLKTTHSPINMQASTLGQTTPVDNRAKNKALFAAGKNLMVNQSVDTIPYMLGAAVAPLRNEMGRKVVNKMSGGELKLQAMGIIGSGEIAGRNADNPADANKERIKSYATGLVSTGLAATSPTAAGAMLMGQTAANVGQAADVYHKSMPDAPPSMGTVPEQQFNINLKDQPVPDFRLTQPGLKEQSIPSSASIAKQGEATHELKSSNIKAVGYNKEDKSMDVAFHSGGNYNYKDVPKSLFDRIKRVKSPGKFFHKHIKRDNSYKYEKMEKEASLLDSHPGKVTNLEAVQPVEMSNMDIIGSLLLGENYVPQRRNQESVYESMQRAKRNTDYLTHHPLLTDNMSKNLSNVFGGDVNKAHKDISHMLSDPSVMGQFKEANSIFDKLENKIYSELANEKQRG